MDQLTDATHAGLWLLGKTVTVTHGKQTHTGKITHVNIQNVPIHPEGLFPMNILLIHIRLDDGPRIRLNPHDPITMKEDPH